MGQSNRFRKAVAANSVLVRAPLVERRAEFRHTGVVKTAPELPARGSSVLADAHGDATHEGQTRAAVVDLLLADGPVSATEIGDKLGLTAAGVRRHLDALIESGEARLVTPPRWQQRGRGRPAKRYQLTAKGRGRLGHAYDDLAGAAMRQLQAIGGETAIEDFARARVQAIVADVTPVAQHEPEQLAAKADEIADAFTSAGFAASTRQVGAGVQICQHHCPVSHVAEEFPQLCEAELDAFRELLGTHVQRLATIANGDCACTTHVPLMQLDKTSPTPGAQPAPAPTSLRKEHR
ncbi:transcriptional regulator [Skermania sp. ID1734]|uniref:helix-turn-helix transcriptional regulator n=1 Tax=Skermania sp. ID1734 TaxID=2597516 RepID=UPI00117D49A6|nr:metalloregulator ArsR/SmtB family transcription factor [Skermania sp. ID1734]TSD95322.1 transcriptional regulator [Skermania sp. ID1734]